MKSVTALFLGLLIFGITLSGCCRTHSRSAAYTYYQPRQLDDGLPTASASSVSMDTTRLIALTKLILTDSFPNIHSLLIIKDKKLIYENYFAGNDQKHGKKLGYIEHSVNQLHDCRSVSKSVISACIGIALKKDIIPSIDEPITNYYPELCHNDDRDSLKKTITIRHLLTMSSGLEWREIGSYGSFFNDETQMDLRFNPIRFILHKPMAAKPGMYWNYNGGNTQLLAEILTRTSGMEIDAFAEKYLFEPLGIRQYEWISLTFKKIPAAASGLRMTSRDMAKFGLLYMNGGKWNGNQLIDSSWVNQSFQSAIERPSLSATLPGGGYGYQFWTYTDQIDNHPIDIVEAKGNGGQAIFFCKSLNLLVVATGGNYNKGLIRNNPHTALTQYIIPSLLSFKPE